MEYLRRGQSLAGYKATLGIVITGLSQRLDAGGTSPDRQRRLAGSIGRLTAELAHIESSLNDNIFLLPDGQAIPDVTYNYIQVLSHLPVSRGAAIPTGELTVLNYAQELRAGDITLQAARASTIASVNSLRKKISSRGWTIENASPDFIIDPESGKKRKAEARYFLLENIESIENAADGDEDQKINDEGVVFKDEVFSFPNPSREDYRRHAIERIGLYLGTSEERILREHQTDVFEALFTYFNSGGTSGTIVLPPGVGKTHIASFLMRVLGVPAIIFSNTKDILAQNGRTIANVCPNMSVTNFFGDEKLLSGDIINTLYQSFPSFSSQPELDFNRFGLVVYDEADLSLGEERHKMHALFPNAIKIALTATPDYAKLDEYEERGLVDTDAEWLETFKNIIYEMPLEEAFKREAIPPLDIHLIRTSSVVRNVSLAPDGDINQAQLARELNQKSRNALILAMIVGLDALPLGFEIPEDQRDELRKIHEKIKAKRTVIHGIGVSHILQLERDLQELGIKAKAIYGTMKGSRRTVVDQVRSGKIQVLLGDEITGRGLDIPELEVGIHAAPTRSPRNLLKQLGRLFRHSPDSGKSKGVAVQLVDTYVTESAKQPILLPSIFDPDFILQNRRIDKKDRQADASLDPKTRRARITSPAITIDGSIDLDAYFEEISLQDLIQSRFRNASLREVNDLIASGFNEILNSKTGEVDLYDVYFELSRRLPPRMSFDINQRAISAIAGEDETEASTARQVLMAINLKTILGVLSQYMTPDVDRNNDLIQHVLSEINGSLESLHLRHAVTIQLHRFSHQSARRFVSQENGIVSDWVRKDVYEDLMREIAGAFRMSPHGLDKGRTEEIATELSRRFNVTKASVKTFIERQNASLDDPPAAGEFEDSTGDEALEGSQSNGIEQVLGTIATRERKVIERRFIDGLTLKEVGEEFGLTPERIRQIEQKALRKLRHPSRSKRLKDFW